MKIFVTGAAGFIGSNLVDRLLSLGHEVIGYDNFSSGKKSFLINAKSDPKFKLIYGDIVKDSLFHLPMSMEECDIIFHFAANADVRYGLNNPHKDLEQNTISTFNVLEAMRVNGIKKIVFPSTGSIYGDAKIYPTSEDAPFPVQTSLYGASKLACEGLIQAYCEGFDFQSYIFRFVSILGERYTHGHVIDFYKSLKNDPSILYILGNGTQRKSYLYVQDCIDAMLLVIKKAKEKINIFNLGTDEFCSVNDSINWIIKHLNVNPKLFYSGGEQGWIGDNPFIFLDCNKIKLLGWKSKVSIHNGIIKTLSYLEKNQ